MKFRHRVEIVLYLVFIGFCVFIGWLAVPALKTWVPLIGNLAGFTIVVFFLVLMACLVAFPVGVFLHFRGRHQIARLEAGKMPANERGYIGAYIASDGKLISAHVPVHSPEVPAHVHIQEDHSQKGGSGGGDWREEMARQKLEWEREKFALLNAPAQNMLPAPRPSVEEIVEKLSSEELEFSTGTSLTTRELIKVGLTGRHIKIIGGSQMGKSSLTGAILEQIRCKYSPAQVRLAILDLEDMTGTLFEDAPHILEMRVNGELRKVHARNPLEVAIMLTWLAEVMRYRYGLIQQRGLAYVDRLPRILIYFEEFLDWKKTLVQRVPDSKLRDDAIAAINTISTRGLKVGLHLLICAQVDYADQALQSAMAQFVGINIAFCVKPKAAQAAGFVDNERLNDNYQAKTPGRYVIEMIGGGDMGVSPEYNVKEKIKALQQARLGDSDIIDGEVEEMEPLDISGTSGTPLVRRSGNGFSDWPDTDSQNNLREETDWPANVRPFSKTLGNEPGEQSDTMSDERPKEYRLSEQEIQQFIAAFKASGNREKALAVIGRGSRYRQHAEEIIQAYGLRKEA